MTVNTDSNNVPSLVTTIIDSYRDAGSALDRRKATCAQNRAPPPSRVLEENIDQAPHEIEKEKKRGLSRFEERFEIGDDDVIFELQEIIAQLQNDLLDILNEIADSDEEVDYTLLADVADAGRDRTIGALLSLKQRLLDAEGRTKSIASDHSQRTNSESSKQPLPSPESSKSEEIIRKEQTSGGADAEQDQPRRSRSGSLLGFFRHHRSSNRNGSDDSSPGRHRFSKRLSIPSNSPTPRATSQEDQQRESTDAETGTTSFETQRTRTSSSNDALSIPRASVVSTGSSEKASTTSTAQLRSSSSMDAATGASSITTVQPNPDNDYLGFCKGAVRLQTGDRQAMQRTKEFNDGWSSSSVYYLTCFNSKCVFASHLDLASIWTKVWLIEEIGIKFRWPFLAKSHVTQNRQVKQSEYTYQCLFCVFSGVEAHVINGTDSYLEHVADAHRGQALGDVIQYRTSCVADRVCEDDEEFDINLFPLTEEEYAQLREQRKSLPDETVDGDMPGDQFPLQPEEINTPWCEDMPEFHPTDTLEAIERQFSIRSFRSVGQG